MNDLLALCAALMSGPNAYKNVLHKFDLTIIYFFYTKTQYVLSMSLALNAEQRHPYPTRFQKRISTKHTINIPEGSQYSDIKRLLKTIKSKNFGIQHYNIIGVDCEINVEVFDEPQARIQLTAKLYELFSFLSEESSLQLIIDIWNNRNNNIDDDEIDNITLTDEQYQDNIQHITGIETCCPICMETSTKDELMAKTTCGHVFHDHCLHKWLTQECSQPTCPMCRHEFY